MSLRERLQSTALRRRAQEPGFSNKPTLGKHTLRYSRLLQRPGFCWIEFPLPSLQRAGGARPSRGATGEAIWALRLLAAGCPCCPCPPSRLPTATRPEILPARPLSGVLYQK